MLVDTMLVFFRRTRRNLSLHPFFSGLTLAGMTLSLLCLGLCFLVLRSAPFLLPTWLTEAKAVAYLRPHTTAQEQEDLVKELRQWPKVQEIRSVSSEEALKVLEAQLGQWKGALEGVQDDPLPSSLEITFKAGDKHPEEITTMVEKIRQLPKVEDVLYGGSLPEHLEILQHLFKTLGVWIPGFLALTVVGFVSSSLRYTIAARQEELEVYSLLGAPALFARAPFYIEAVLLGLASGLLASCGLMALISISRHALEWPLGALFSLTTWEAFYFPAGTTASGLALSWLGAWISLATSPHAKGMK